MVRRASSISPQIVVRSGEPTGPIIRNAQKKPIPRIVPGTEREYSMSSGSEPRSGYLARGAGRDYGLSGGREPRGGSLEGWPSPAAPAATAPFAAPPAAAISRLS